MNVVRGNPSVSITRAKNPRITTPRSGLNQVRLGQKGVEGVPFFKRLMIKAREKIIRMMQSPKGRNPTPGCLKLPILRCTELHAPTTAITNRMYPVTRSHFSMAGLSLLKAFEI